MVGSAAAPNPDSTACRLSIRRSMPSVCYGSGPQRHSHSEECRPEELAMWRARLRLGLGLGLGLGPGLAARLDVLLVLDVVPDGATGRGAQHGMAASEVAGDAAHHRA